MLRKLKQLNKWVTSSRPILIGPGLISIPRSLARFSSPALSLSATCGGIAIATGLGDMCCRQRVQKYKEGRRGGEKKAREKETKKKIPGCDERARTFKHSRRDEATRRSWREILCAFRACSFYICVYIYKYIYTYMCIYLLINLFIYIYIYFSSRFWIFVHFLNEIQRTRATKSNCSFVSFFFIYLFIFLTGFFFNLDFFFN